MSKNGMAFGLNSRGVDLRHLPNPNTVYTIDFPLLNGGLNLYDLDYRLKTSESPDMRNLRWKDGALGGRYGQAWVIEPATPAEVGYTAFRDLFWDYAFVHVGTEIRCFDPIAVSPAYTVLKTGVPANRGTFFRFGDYLMYKNKGGYYRIAYNSAGLTPATKFTVTTAADNAYVPITYINMNPTTMAGDAYQPENRLSSSKTLWYSAEVGVTVYNIPYGSDSYHPTAVTKVVVNGVTKTAGTDYTFTVDTTTKQAYVTFSAAPAVPTPFVPNTVQITYTSTNTDAYNAVMDCPYAIVYGGDQNLCVVLGGCPAQPNAYFWSDNDSVSMNPFYFPMEQYNFAGDTESAIMGFGKQQGFLVVLSKKGVGRVNFGTTTTTSDRLQIEMPYTSINSRIGCDYPWSIQLVDNNIVFCNLEHGVCLLADSSAAHENNIIELGKKVNGNEVRHGMLYNVFAAGQDGVYSTIYEDKYWLVAEQNAYVWDFRLSNYTDPVWFFYTNIKGIAYIVDNDVLYHINTGGGASVFKHNYYNDYGEPIDKVYQFATQMMGTYDRLKDVRSLLLCVRSDTGGDTRIKYITDYEDRYDLTPIPIWTWRLVPWNMNQWRLTVVKFAVVVRRAPMCRHVRHFALRLENNTADQDLSVVSAQVQYVFVGRQR